MNRKRNPSTSSESADSAEEERRRDLKERDEFSKRLKEKDDSKTRKVVEATTSKKAFEEAAKRLKLETEDREKLLPKLRIQSRRDYLAKRKEDKVAELEADILDDEYLFDESKLTKKEKEDRALKKHLLDIAKKHEQARELERVQRYHMPKDMKKGEKDEYVEVDEREKLPNSEQKKWEAEQLQSALYKFGSKDAKADEYELLLDDEIEFVQVLRMDGSKDMEKKPEVSEAEKKKMTIEETKKSLPVYPFRDDLIAAIKEHQVSFEAPKGS
jgi:pre-mRNA-splicing factor ATP-dependent RNA helicase DHX16